MPFQEASYLRMLKTPKVLVISLVLSTATSTQGFLDPTVEPHFRQYEIGPEFVGLVFLVMSAAYAISSPLAGWYTGKIHNKLPIMVVGLLVTFVGYMLLGPSSLLGLPSSLWLSTLAMFILGLAYSMAFIPTFEALLDSIVEQGCPDDVTTYSLVSGWWSCFNGLGEVAGSGLGGVFMDFYSFDIGTNSVAFWVLGTAFVLSFYILYELFAARCSRERDLEDGSKFDSDYFEKKPLLAGLPRQNSLSTKATFDNIRQWAAKGAIEGQAGHEESVCNCACCVESKRLKGRLAANCTNQREHNWRRSLFHSV